MKYLIVLVFLQITWAEYHSESPCPARPVQQNFEIRKVILISFEVNSNLMYLHRFQEDGTL
jgi:hypothetical protein